MDKPKITEKKQTEKPAKPRKDFPLFPHDCGQWAKKVLGRTRYFGPWKDPQGALNKWLDQKDDLLAGREPAQDADGVTVVQLVDEFLKSCEGRVETGELRPRTYADYSLICKRVLDVFGNRTVTSLLPADFRRLKAAFAKTHGPVALRADITKARVMFNWGKANLDVIPKYGTEFDKPARAVMRRARNERAKKLFSREDIVALLADAGVKLRAMIYLGINCAFGNDDCAKLTTADLGLKKRWHWLARHKTGIERGGPLWPETVAAIEAVLANRPEPAREELADRVFLTGHGGSFEGSHKNNPISKEFAKLLKKLDLHQKGRNFYSLRHTFFTQAKRTKDMISVHYLMGHAADADDMDDVYDEGTFDEDLITVSEYVRSWLALPPALPATASAAGAEQQAGLRLYEPETPEVILPSPDSEDASSRAG